MKKTGFNGFNEFNGFNVYDFSVDYDVIAVDDIKDIHKYLMKKNDIVWYVCIKKYLDLLKQYF